MYSARLSCELVLHQQLDDAMPEDFSHRLRAEEWDINEGALLVKATFKHDSVEMRVPTETTEVPWVWKPRCFTRSTRCAGARLR